MTRFNEIGDILGLIGVLDYLLLLLVPVGQRVELDGGGAAAIIIRNRQLHKILAPMIVLVRYLYHIQINIP